MYWYRKSSKFLSAVQNRRLGNQFIHRRCRPITSLLLCLFLFQIRIQEGFLWDLVIRCFFLVMLLSYHRGRRLGGGTGGTVP